MRDGTNDSTVVACEQISQGLLVTFADRKTFLFEDQVLFESRDTLGNQVTSPPEEDEEYSAGAEEIN
jgi:hypothetical protein